MPRSSQFPFLLSCNPWELHLGIKKALQSFSELQGLKNSYGVSPTILSSHYRQLLVRYAAVLRSLGAQCP